VSDPAGAVLGMVAAALSGFVVGMVVCTVLS
jgi:hypothetical protein